MRTPTSWRVPRRSTAGRLFLIALGWALFPTLALAAPGDDGLTAWEAGGIGLVFSVIVALAGGLSRRAVSGLDEHIRRIESQQEARNGELRDVLVSLGQIRAEKERLTRLEESLRQTRETFAQRSELVELRTETRAELKEIRADVHETRADVSKILNILSGGRPNA